MGKSNPSARGYAVSTMVSGRTTNGIQFGDKLAGLPGFTGSGPFATNAVNIRGPPFAGPNYKSIGGKVNSVTNMPYLRPATDQLGRLIKGPNNRTLYYPISFSNQLGGVGGLDYSPNAPSADGVNYNFRVYQVKKLMMPLGSGANARPALL